MKRMSVTAAAALAVLPSLVALRLVAQTCVEGFGGQEAYYPVLEAVDQLTRASDEGRFIQTLAKRAPTWLLQFPSHVKPGQRDRWNVTR